MARNDKRLAIELITSVDVDCALRYARDFFMWIVHEDTIPFDMIHDDQLRRLVDGLRHSDSTRRVLDQRFPKKGHPPGARFGHRTREDAYRRRDR